MPAGVGEDRSEIHGRRGISRRASVKAALGRHAALLSGGGAAEWGPRFPLRSSSGAGAVARGGRARSRSSGRSADGAGRGGVEVLAGPRGALRVGPATLAPSSTSATPVAPGGAAAVLPLGVLGQLSDALSGGAWAASSALRGACSAASWLAPVRSAMCSARAARASPPARSAARRARVLLLHLLLDVSFATISGAPTAPGPPPPGLRRLALLRRRRRQRPADRP